MGLECIDGYVQFFENVLITVPVDEKAYNAPLLGRKASIDVLVLKTHRDGRNTRPLAARGIHAGC